MTLSTHWLTLPLLIPRVFFLSDYYPLTNIRHLILLKKLFHFPYFSLPSPLFFLSFSQSKLQPPLLLSLSMRPLYSAFQSWTGGLSIPHSHWLSLTTWSKSGPPCSAVRPALWVFQWNNSTAAVGREQGPGKRQTERGRDGEPKMDMANLFKHFFREFFNFPSFL